ncbi:DUF922 domain-containing protein [Seonamhaeicola marinus]|uniref:DUF922 domain-containing protein n=1 Tax=Seonamhaeicola marinus TaxID=1912246 RepID=A0A5D0HJX1_9FLAO|nr:DUF922 domain-containing protein [Seonamhaeicola marinus]TYA71545.1 DUF922 domain-containing protein [Seonamhaeicola marinus]
MIRIIIVLCCFLCVQDEPVISWNDSYKLTWADFKDSPNPNTSAVAITASGISFGYSIKQTDTQVVGFSTEVYAHFYPEQSWYKPERADAHVLAHEQLHFDITELHARKLRYRISQLGISNTIKNKLRQLQKDINTELRALQNKYDSETDHSRNFEAQAQWNAYIAKELKTYSRFKSK